MRLLTEAFDIVKNTGDCDSGLETAAILKSHLEFLELALILVNLSVNVRQIYCAGCYLPDSACYLPMAVLRAVISVFNLLFLGSILIVKYYKIFVVFCRYPNIYSAF